MSRLTAVPAVLAFLLLVPGAASAQTSSAEKGSPWEVGAGIGVGVNEPANAFDRCDPSSTRGTISLRGSYSVEPWLNVGVLGSGHADVGEDFCVFPTGRVERPGTQREYPDRIRGSSSYVSTEARIAVDLRRTVETVSPFVIAGVGRIWGKELHYPELGIGAEVPMGGISLRLEALGRWLSVPYDSVTTGYDDEGVLTELSRVRLDEDHFPVIFRLGVDWSP